MKTRKRFYTASVEGGRSPCELRSSQLGGNCAYRIRFGNGRNSCHSRRSFGARNGLRCAERISNRIFRPAAPQPTITTSQLSSRIRSYRQPPMDDLRAAYLNQTYALSISTATTEGLKRFMDFDPKARRWARLLNLHVPRAGERQVALLVGQVEPDVPKRRELSPKLCRTIGTVVRRRIWRPARTRGANRHRFLCFALYMAYSDSF